MYHYPANHLDSPCQAKIVIALALLLTLFDVVRHQDWAICILGWFLHGMITTVLSLPGFHRPRLFAWRHPGNSSGTTPNMVRGWGASTAVKSRGCEARRQQRWLVVRDYIWLQYNIVEPLEKFRTRFLSQFKREKLVCSLLYRFGFW